MPRTDGEASAQSRSLGLMARDVMEGYVMLNPLVLKKLDDPTCKELHRQIRKLQTSVRMEGVSPSNTESLRTRNHRLQRMHQAMIVLEHYARLNRISLT